MSSDYCTCAHIKKDSALQAAKLAKSLPILSQLTCVQCSWQGDYSTIIDHSKKSRHSLAIKHISGAPELFCLKCKDFQYHSTFDEITRCKMRQPNPIRTPMGIVNMGSTCFLSSVLQLILSNPFLLRFFAISDLFAVKCKACTAAYEDPPRYCMFCELQKLFRSNSANDK
jgi:ubiquitin carboxyl-terminal hydrolase 22/27/51